MIDYIKKGLSIENIFLGVIAFLVLCVKSFEIQSYDMWWHLKTGEWILKNGRIPNTDIFSWYGMSKDFSWTAHEWLTDILYFSIYKVFSFQGLIIFTYVLWLVIFFVFAFKYKDHLKDRFSLTMLWLIIFAISTTPFFYVRPQSISFILLSIQYLILLDYIEDKKDRLYIIPLLCLLLVNFHGGIVISSFVIIALVIITNALDFEIGKLKSTRLENKKRTKLTKILLLSILISLINPIGYKALTYPFITMKKDFFMNYISEWKSADFHNIAGMILFISFMFSVFVMFLSDKKIKLQHICIFLLYFYFSLKYQRMLPYFIFYSTPIYFYYLGDIHFKKTIKNLRIVKIDRNKEKKDLGVKGKLFIKTVLLIMCFIFLVVYYPKLKEGFNNPVSKEKYPIDGIEILKEYKPKKLYNYYDFGGYLIFTLHDEGIFPFIDGRADLFANKGEIDNSTVFEDAVKINRLEDTDKILKAYDIDSVFIPKDAPLTQYLKAKNEWIVKYEDDLIAFFIHKEN